MKLFIQLLINGVVSSAVYALLAIGFGIIYRSLRFFNISYGGIYLIAPYTVIFWSQEYGLPLFVCILFGIITAILVSIFIEKSVFIPFEKKEAKGGVLFVVSLGAFIIIQNLIAMFFGNDIKTVDFPVTGSLEFNSFIITKFQIIQLIVSSTVIFLFWLMIRKNNFFKALWAIGDNPTLIKVLGYPYNKMRMILFILSSFFVSIASLLTFFDVGIDPYVGMKALLIAAVAVIVGGINSFIGWILGAFLIGTIEALSVWKFSSNWTEAVVYALLILTLLFKPEGLFSLYKRRG